MVKEKGITLVSLVVTIIILIILAGVSINLLLGENGVITKSKEAKRAQEIAEIKEKLSLEIAAAETDAILRNESLEQQQLEDIVSKYGTLQEDKDTIITNKNNYEISLKEIWYGVLSESGSYTDKVKQIEILEKELEELQEKYKELEEINSGNSEILDDLRGQIKELEAQLEALQTEIANTTVTADKLLKDYTAYKDGQLITGTMADNGALNATLNAGESFTIPAGYTTGGKVTANSLSSQTQATATASDISSGKTAWVNGKLLTGNGSNTKLEPITISCYLVNTNSSRCFIFNLNEKYSVVTLESCSGAGSGTIWLDDVNIGSINSSTSTPVTYDVTMGSVFKISGNQVIFTITIE